MKQAKNIFFQKNFEEITGCRSNFTSARLFLKKLMPPIYNITIRLSKNNEDILVFYLKTTIFQMWFL